MNADTPLCPECKEEMSGVGMDDVYEDAPGTEYGVKVISRRIYFECLVHGTTFTEDMTVTDETLPFLTN
jgi:hypothetical protein